MIDEESHVEPFSSYNVYQPTRNLDVTVEQNS